MKLDAHPKTMAGIMVALGIFGIGVILTVGFFERDALLGVGVTMAVIGGAGTILGCIHMGSQRDDEPEEAKERANMSIAPNRIPPRVERQREYDDEDDYDDDGPLSYAPCSASPSPARNLNNEVVDPVTGLPLRGAVTPGYGTPVKGTAVVPPTAFVSTERVHHDGARFERSGSRAAFPLSPFENRTFPIPDALAASAPAVAAPRPMPPAAMTMDAANRMGRSPKVVFASGYDPRGRMGNTEAEVEAQVRAHRDYEADQFHRNTHVKAGDEDQLPAGYWSPA